MTSGGGSEFAFAGRLGNARGKRLFFLGVLQAGDRQDNL